MPVVDHVGDFLNFRPDGLFGLVHHLKATKQSLKCVCHSGEPQRVVGIRLGLRIV